MNRSHYQFGSLYLEPRKKGPEVWVFRWRERDEGGRDRLRKRIVGSTVEYPTKGQAQRAIEAHRLDLNRGTTSQTSAPQTIRQLVEHYRLKEMPMDTHEKKRRSTKLVYNTNLNTHILPRWGRYPLRRVSTIEVEDWLSSLPLAPGTRTKVRNVFSMIFRHAIRWGWLGQHENPIAMVRVSGRRIRTPEILTGDEFQTLMLGLPQRERLIGTLCATAGLRIGEVLGLKWSDVSFANNSVNVCRSFSDGSIGPCKTEISQQPVPLDKSVTAELHEWRLICGYAKGTDWIFASTKKFGKEPVWPDSLRQKILQPIARRVGIAKRIGWHTFRHTYSSLLAHTGNDVRVVQELMRHAKVATTMEIYTHAAMDKKRVAQQKAVDHLLSRDKDGTTGNPYVPKLFPEM
jgi:integrase